LAPTPEYSRRATRFPGIGRELCNAILKKPDGILDRPRHDPARVAAAFFDRIEAEVIAETMGLWMDQKAILGEVLDTYLIALVS
jgi:hypothetical protein